MKKILVLLILVAAIWGCKNDKAEKNVNNKFDVEVPLLDSTLITDTSWGQIHKNADFEELQNIFGSANVKNERICGPECADSVDVTFVYKGDKKEITVYWMDTFYLKKIAFLESWQPDAPYHTAEGLKMGSTLSDLLRVNGQKITFSGFGWDYGGYVQSYNNGTLEKSAAKFRLDLDDYSDNSLVGDVELNTDMPSVKKVLDKIKVWQISFVPGKNE